jgi:16S rRNA (cytosine967-C5)-methyltransferase
MKAVRVEAHKIIYNILKKRQFSSKLLSQMLNKQQGDDSDLLFKLVKGTIKMYRHLDFVAASYTDEEKYKNTDIKIKIMLYLGLYQLRFLTGIPEYAIINETVDAAKSLFGDKIASFINGVLRSYQRNPQINYPTSIIQRLAYEYSFDEEMIRNFIDLYGEEETEYACMYFNEVPKLRVRVNTLATSPQKFLQYFSRRDVIFRQLDASENFMESENSEKVLNDVAFSEGYFSVQDPAAGLVVELMEPQLDMNIIDMFAAPGSKACYCAELMQDTGEVVAIDKMPNKCKMIKQNCERLKLNHVKVIAEDAFKYGPVAAAYDKVLLDVPCSGWGVMQKKAEIRWQFSQDLPQLIKIQENALKTGAKFVRSKSDLIYSTCTLNPQENEAQIDNFLKKHPDFELVHAENIIPTQYTQDGFLKTIPWKHGLDGTFAARMRRKT